MKEIAVVEKAKRNYQLDVLKLFLAMIVFVSHTEKFVGENTTGVTVNWLGLLGWMSVFCFFVISGMLMANSFDNKESDLPPGKQAFDYVIKKFMGLSSKYWTALLIGVIVFIISYIYLGTPQMILQLIGQIVPEAFCLNLCGIVGIEVNVATWYISAMLICMLPLAYFLAKNKSFFYYVMAPCIALFTWGWMFNQENPFVGRKRFYSICFGGLILGFCGISFGVIAYLISKYVKNKKSAKQYSMLITVIEAVSYLMFGICWLSSDLSKAKIVFPVFPLFMIAIAMTFSGKSYISKLFRFSWMRFAAPASLTIYLNHIAARKIVQTFFPGESYKISSLLMVAFTVVLILVYLALLKLWALIKKKIQPKQVVESTN